MKVLSGNISEILESQLLEGNEEKAIRKFIENNEIDE